MEVTFSHCEQKCGACGQKPELQNSVIWRLALAALLILATTGVRSETPRGLSAGWVSMGALGMLLAHEAGHMGVAAAMGIDADIDDFTVVYPSENLTSRQQLRVASAGFQSQWLLSEVAFRHLNDGQIARRSFAAGAIITHLGISAAYLTFLKDHDDGDIMGIANALGEDKDAVATLVAIPALLDTWRLLGNPPEWVPSLSVASKGLMAAWAWSW